MRINTSDFVSFIIPIKNNKSISGIFDGFKGLTPVQTYYRIKYLLSERGIDLLKERTAEKPTVDECNVLLEKTIHPHISIIEYDVEGNIKSVKKLKRKIYNRHLLFHLTDTVKLRETFRLGLSNGFLSFSIQIRPYKQLSLKIEEHTPENQNIREYILFGCILKFFENYPNEPFVIVKTNFTYDKDRKLVFLKKGTNQLFKVYKKSMTKLIFIEDIYNEVQEEIKEEIKEIEKFEVTIQ